MPTKPKAPKPSKSKAPNLPAETHQTVEKLSDSLTTNHGVPISDNQNSLRAGVRGPTLIEDFILREKITHFDHERARAPFASTRDFYERTRPAENEMLNLIRAGAFDSFGEPRTAQFLHLQHLA